MIDASFWELANPRQFCTAVLHVALSALVLLSKERSRTAVCIRVIIAVFGSWSDLTQTAFFMSTSSQPQPSAVSTRRKRAMIACVHCRRRKIKCVTSEEPPRNPCARCTRRRLDCVYVAVVDDDYPLSSTSTPESPVSNLPASGYPQANPSYPRTMPSDHYGGYNSAYSVATPSSYPIANGGHSMPGPFPPSFPLPSSHGYPGYPGNGQLQPPTHRSPYSPMPNPQQGGHPIYPSSGGNPGYFQYQQHPFPHNMSHQSQWPQGSMQHQPRCNCSGHCSGSCGLRRS
ncbi:hypothetical protein C8J57DRAFT_1462714 [Mycena rebaudengoi]|nr:hypothetical protein C8J57DRAFT_1462714 [Mycena rebaudengoi]